MSIMGDAPKLFLFVMPLLAGAVIVSVVWPEGIGFMGPVWKIGRIVGIVLAAIGIVFWASAAVSLVSAYKEDRLATKGAYGLSRHPIFAWWIFFVLPPAALIINSWPFLVVAFIMFLIAVPAARREDAYLQQRYGEAFTEYQSKVRRILPLPKLSKPSEDS